MEKRGAGLSRLRNESVSGRLLDLLHSSRTRRVKAFRRKESSEEERPDVLDFEFVSSFGFRTSNFTPSRRHSCLPPKLIRVSIFICAMRLREGYCASARYLV